MIKHTQQCTRGTNFLIKEALCEPVLFHVLKEQNISILCCLLFYSTIFQKVKLYFLLHDIYSADILHFQRNIKKNIKKKINNLIKYNV